MIILKQAHLTQRLEVWSPRYHDKNDGGEPVVLLHQGKLYHGSSEYVIVEFTKAKPLIGLRFAIKRSKALKFPVTTNGKAAMNAVPMSALQPYVTQEEDKATIRNNLYNWGWWSSHAK